MKIRTVGSKGVSPSKSAEKERSISFRTDAKRTSIKHNNRTVEDTSLLKNYGNHINKEMTSHNKILVAEDIADVYQEEFGDTVKKYNKNKRKDRKISETKTGYLRYVKNSNSLDYQREFIVQMGRKEDQEERPISEDDANEIYTDYLEQFNEKFPDMRIYNAVIHHDEATPHMHFNVVPLAEGYKQGMLKRPSFSKVLRGHGMDMKEFCEWNRKTLGGLMEDKLGEKRQKVGSHDYVPPEQFRQGVRSATAKANSIVSSANSKATTISSSASVQASSTISNASIKASSMISSADTQISLSNSFLNFSSAGLDEQSGLQSMTSVSQSSTAVSQSQTSLAQRSSAVSLTYASFAMSSSAYKLSMQSTAQLTTADSLDSKEASVDAKMSELSKVKQFIEDNMPKTQEFLKWAKQKIEEAKEAINKHDAEEKKRVTEELNNESEDIEQTQSQANLFGDGLEDLSSKRDNGLQK